MSSPSLGLMRLEPTLSSRAMPLEHALCARGCGTALEFANDRDGYTIERCPRPGCRDDWRRVVPSIAAAERSRAGFSGRRTGIWQRVLAALPTERSERTVAPAIADALGLRSRQDRNAVAMALRQLWATNRAGRATPSTRTDYRQQWAYWRLGGAS